MNIQDLKNKIVVLFGKTRSFSKDEFEMQLNFHKIQLRRAWRDDAFIVIEGAMMSPDESKTIEELHISNKTKFIDIEDFEAMLIQTVDEDSLLMSLKLSDDKNRLKDFITNKKISNQLFLKLLKMYKWGGEDFFENDDNRDVSASLISRFYKNIQRNHNVQFSKVGFIHLANQTANSDIIEAMVFLEPLKSSFQNDEKDQGFRVIMSVATNIITPDNVLKYLIENSNSYIKELIAMRNYISPEIQTALLNTNDRSVLQSLSCAKNITDEVFDVLVKESLFSKNMAKYIELDRKRFDYFKEHFPAQLAQNETLNLAMQDGLVKLYQNEVNLMLATNQKLSRDVIEQLLKQKDEKIDFALFSNINTPKDILSKAHDNIINHFALANNPSTPEHVFYHLYKSGNIKILTSLAKNISTPIEILQQLSLDMRLDRYVKQNPTFGEYIKKENIGWL